MIQLFQASHRARITENFVTLEVERILLYCYFIVTIIFCFVSDGRINRAAGAVQGPADRERRTTPADGSTDRDQRETERGSRRTEDQDPTVTGGCCHGNQPVI